LVVRVVTTGSDFVVGVAGSLGSGAGSELEGSTSDVGAASMPRRLAARRKYTRGKCMSSRYASRIKFAQRGEAAPSSWRFLAAILFEKNSSGWAVAECKRPCWRLCLVLIDAHKDPASEAVLNET
jgi:hypothetical protein